MSSSGGGVPSVVTTTYVSVSELEGRGDGEGDGHYKRLSSDGSDDIHVVDQNLLQLHGQGGMERSSSESSEDEPNSSDEERCLPIYIHVQCTCSYVAGLVMTWSFVVRLSSNQTSNTDLLYQQIVD